MVSSWTQAASTEHTIEVIAGPTTGSNDPSVFAFRIFPLVDVFGVTVGVNELASYNAYLTMTAGMTNLDKTVLYAGIVNGPLITGDRIWHRLSGLQAGKPRVLRCGRNQTIAPAVPSNGGCVHTRQETLTELSATSGALRILETTAIGSDASKAVIAGSRSGLAGITTDIILAPHVIIAAGAFAAPGPVTLKFFLDIEARRLPGGVFPR